MSDQAQDKKEDEEDLDAPLPPVPGGGFDLALKLAGRELRAGLKGFRIFVACLALGVAAIAAVGSLSDAILMGLRVEGRTLLGGDLEVRVNNTRANAEQLAAMRSGTRNISGVAELRAMAREANPAPGAEAKQHLVELKVVDEYYPLVGEVGLTPKLTMTDALARRGNAFGAVADPSVLNRLGLKVGDRMRLGNAEVIVTATLDKEPDRVASVLRLGPTVMIGTDAINAAGLIQPGSQVQYRYRLLLWDDSDPVKWAGWLREDLPESGWRIRGTEDAAPGVERFVDRMALFLTFAGLTALLVGGIGVGNAVRAYLEGKTATIATLKCVGARGDLVFMLYLFQILALAGVGIVIGLIGGVVLPWAGVYAFKDYLPVAPQLGFYWKPLVIAAGFGVLTALTFALWPLGKARDIPAQALFRSRVVPLSGRPHGYAFWGALLFGIGLAGLTIATASRKDFAVIFVAGAIAIIVILRVAAAIAAKLAARARGTSKPSLRLAISNLHRPGASTTSVMISMGLGLTVLVAVALIQGVLGRQISERLPALAPAFFFIDIQPDQVQAFEQAVKAVPGTGTFKRMPSLRGTIVAIKGVDVDVAPVQEDARWAIRGDRALTYSADLPDDTRIVSGAWWPRDYAGPPLISIDANVAKGFGVKVGDSLTINVLGRDIEAKIASLREIDWRSLRFDFAIIFAPGTLERAPHSHIAAVQAEASAEDAVERAATSGFPNVSSIRVREALGEAARMLDGIGSAVRGIAGVAIVAGVLVLAGAIATDQRKRVFDAVVFKVLGARRRIVLGAFLLEYGLLGLITGVIAAIAGTLVAWAVVVFLMDMGWTFLPGVAVGTVIAAIVVTVALGFAGTWRALGQKAAPHLRNR